MQNFRVLASILTDFSNFLLEKREKETEKISKIVSEGNKMQSFAYAQRAKAEPIRAVSWRRIIVTQLARRIALQPPLVLQITKTWPFQ